MKQKTLIIGLVFIAHLVSLNSFGQANQVVTAEMGYSTVLSQPDSENSLHKLQNKKSLEEKLKDFSSEAIIGQDRGGGDICENRIKVVRDKITSWIKNEWHNDLILPNNISHEQYSRLMLQYLPNSKIKISCVSEGDQGHPVTVFGSAKTCAFSHKEKSITCDTNKIMALTEIDLFVLIHHDYAGLAGIEPPNKYDSNYDVSNQIPNYIEDQIIKVLVEKKVSKQYANSDKDGIYLVGESINYEDDVIQVPTETTLRFNSQINIPAKAHSTRIITSVLSRHNDLQLVLWCSFDGSSSFNRIDSNQFIAKGTEVKIKSISRLDAERVREPYVDQIKISFINSYASVSCQKALLNGDFEHSEVPIENINIKELSKALSKTKNILINKKDTTLEQLPQNSTFRLKKSLNIKSTLDGPKVLLGAKKEIAYESMSRTIDCGIIANPWKPIFKKGNKFTINNITSKLEIISKSEDSENILVALNYKLETNEGYSVMCSLQFVDTNIDYNNLNLLSKNFADKWSTITPNGKEVSMHISIEEFYQIVGEFIDIKLPPAEEFEF